MNLSQRSKILDYKGRGIVYCIHALEEINRLRKNRKGWDENLGKEHFYCLVAIAELEKEN